MEVVLLEPVHDLVEGRVAALDFGSKCEAGKRQTPCKLCFLAKIRLALHPLIEFMNRFLVITLKYQ